LKIIIFKGTHEGGHKSLVNTRPLNDLYIILVPKKINTSLPSDFRSISVINGLNEFYQKFRQQEYNHTWETY
jgi:hypothetical protein